MTGHVNNSGTWNEVQKGYVNDSGVGKEVQTLGVNDSGVGKIVYENIFRLSFEDSWTGNVPDGWTVVDTPDSWFLGNSEQSTSYNTHETYSWLIELNANNYNENFEAYYEFEGSKYSVIKFDVYIETLEPDSYVEFVTGSRYDFTDSAYYNSGADEGGHYDVTLTVGSETTLYFTVRSDPSDLIRFYGDNVRFIE